jgi:triosephosphate isomerase (TIM)
MSDRRPIIAGNWKMHHDHFTAIQVTQKLSYLLDTSDYDRCEVVLCVPFTDLRSIQTVIQADNLSIQLGAQDCFSEDAGAFTGEISPVFLAKLSVQYVIVGHSERRMLFGDTDEAVAKKVRKVLEHGMSPIVCVGETLEEREAGTTEARVASQISGAFQGLRTPDAERCVVAYEPIWAIGTGRTATAEDANATIGAIRSTLVEVVPRADLRIQYGGSVKPGNITELMAQPEIDGALVGGASLDPEDFARIIKY